MTQKLHIYAYKEINTNVTSKIEHKIVKDVKIMNNMTEKIVKFKNDYIDSEKMDKLEDEIETIETVKLHWTNAKHHFNVIDLVIIVIMVIIIMALIVYIKCMKNQSDKKMDHAINLQKLLELGEIAV